MRVQVTLKKQGSRVSPPKTLQHDGRSLLTTFGDTSSSYTAGPNRDKEHELHYYS